MRYACPSATDRSACGPLALAMGSESLGWGPGLLQFFLLCLTEEQLPVASPLLGKSLNAPFFFS